MAKTAPSSDLGIKKKQSSPRWLTGRYVLLQKNSELYITTTEQLEAGDKGKAPLKIHKPDINFAGYGYGYGGQ